MAYRKFGRTGWQVREISFGAWAFGGSRGHVCEDRVKIEATYDAYIREQVHQRW